LALVALLAHGRAAGATRLDRIGRSNSHVMGASSAADVVSYQTAYLTRGRSAQISVVAAGDVMLGRTVTATMRARDDFRYPLARIAPRLRQADLALATLEAQLIPDCPTSRKGLKLCADPRAVETLRDAGIDVVSVANNHARDFDETGLATSAEQLRQAGIEVAGFDGPVHVVLEKTRFAILAYDAVAGPFDSRRMRSEIAAARRQSDAVIVMMHWGREYEVVPHPLQRRLAAAASTAGADLIIGSHPHAVQPLEPVGRATVAYSLGNAVFDQATPKSTRRGAIGSFTFCDGTLTRSALGAIRISADGTPRWSAVDDSHAAVP
jgi:poly-gamma-glutamate synthesis protein (capsule biosynthesis protein)